MSGNNVLRAVAAIVTLISLIALIVFMILSIIKAFWAPAVICAILSLFFGYFAWIDYNKYIRKTE